MHVTPTGIIRIKKIFKPRQWKPNPLTCIRNGSGHTQHIMSEVIHGSIRIIVYYCIHITATTATAAAVNALWHREGRLRITHTSSSHNPDSLAKTHRVSTQLKHDSLFVPRRHLSRFCHNVSLPMSRGKKKFHPLFHL